MLQLSRRSQSFSLPYRASTSPSNSTEKSTNAEDTASKPQDAQVNHSAVTHKTFSILLATAQVKVISAHGETAKVRALIDQGSEISLVSERLVQRLKLPRNHSTLSLVGIGAQKANQTKGVTSFKIAPHYDSSIGLTVSAHILPRLTSSVPSLKADSTSWAHLKGITLADPDFCTPQSIDLILGADSYNQIIEDGLLRESADQPIAQFTKLGWIISGPTGSSNTSITANGYHVSVDQELYNLLHRFWELDSVPSSAPRLSPEEQQCESHFAATHSRDTTGRYIVRLPFKHSTEKLGESKAKAHRMMTHLLTKLERNPGLAHSYKQFMTEYDQLHHMQRVANSQPEPPHAYYLPHHGVWRENSLTTKLRVVFNGSSRTTSGYSLNDLLHTGKKLQKELINVLFWFRLFRYVFTADVEKMYRQIHVHLEDWDYQRIIWIDDSNHLVTYCLTTVTYGLACAPYLALRTFEQLVQDEGTKFPLAVSTLNKGRYVDDVFGGADSIEEASQIVEQLHRLCMAGGFPLQKWTSNHQDVLASIAPGKQINATSLQIEETFQVNALGLIWQPSTDTFHFTWNLTATDVITKRSILSIVAKLFDPLGFLSPVIIQAKVLIQELWTINLGWDDPVPSHISQKWTHYLTQFQDMPNFSIPRWIGFKSDYKMEIHGFYDASQKAIAAAVYIRTVNSDGHVNTTLLSSKTKVAPLKRQTIPRLELAGAVLLTKLVSCILAVYEIPDVPIYLWTDSAITHTWLTNHPSRWKEFVHNRVCYVQETLPHARWNFVPGKDNPADLATRGLTPNQLLDELAWWTGPPWLSDHSSTWPKEPQKPHQSVHLEEKAVQVSTISTNMSTTLWDLIHRYSNLTRLSRITAICRRVISRLRGTRTSSMTHPLAPEELESSMLYWVKAVQQLTFHLEIKALSNGNPLPKASSLLRLTPFIDSAGLIRVGGRLHSAALSNNAKHPLILPKNSTLTTLLIADAHNRTLHGGTQVTLAFIRNNYWIVGGRAPVRSFILKCVRCSRFRQKRAQQLMGQLPIERVTPSRPFLHSGIDYAGPLLIKTWRGRNARTYKAYIALFVCLSTSAIHLEFVTDYTADAFIAAYKRFAARRGICATLTSDCGSNLKGADEELKRLLSSSSQEFGRLAAMLANDGTRWKFIPPAAPHFGGKWEAGVRSVKNHELRT
ncbi:PREDICTED: uncharacterized protein LOC105558453 [Vollenhovia emeryi]|uniref:uncharacterized protein LOC105558453 n=1 Tax=Vollenhovia emeryi TaxID=411798 RepID=UPI0005F42E1E|nr:PREDICTED: uncharacterized protein LOC105558453 [Vollenhovia emeryi]